MVDASETNTYSLRRGPPKDSEGGIVDSCDRYGDNRFEYSRVAQFAHDPAAHQHFCHDLRLRRGETADERYVEGWDVLVLLSSWLEQPHDANAADPLVEIPVLESD